MCRYKHFKISTHHTSNQKTTLASNQTKNRIQTLVFSHTKDLQMQQPTYRYNSLSFSSHSVSTRSSDSLVLSIPYVRSSLDTCHWSGIQELGNSLPPDT